MPASAPATGPPPEPTGRPDDPAGPSADGELPELVSGLTGDQGDRGPQLRRLARLLATSARAAGAGAVASGRWLSDLVPAIAPAVTVRDQATLRERFDGLTGDALADAVIDAAARTSAAIGAAAGAVAAVEFAAPPLLLTAPAVLSAETLAVIAVEIKLVGELHEVYGARPYGGPSQRAAGYLGAWVRRRGLRGGDHGGFNAALGGTAKRQLRKRVLRRAGRSAGSMLPMLAGAAAGAELNRRQTRSLGQDVQADLRRR